MQDLINTWREGKDNVSSSGDTEAIIMYAKSRKRNVLYAHYGTILILSITLVLVALFYLKTPFNEALSHAGMCLMMATLIIRIVVEVISIGKSRSIDLTSNTEQVIKAALSFYGFRKTVHGPVTLAIVGCYVIGFYLLTPEFSKYISFKWIVAMHVSFVIGAIFLIWIIKKGIRKEIASIEFLSGMRNEIISNEEQNV
jgi:hypothetical protein